MYQYVAAKSRVCSRLCRRILSRLSLKTLFLLAIGIFVSFYLFSALHTVSYVWQTTVLSSYISPIARTSCIYSTNQAPPKDVKIALLMLYGNDNGAWGEDLMQAVIENRRQYAALHGYDIINANNEIDHSKPVAWSKLSAVEHHLDKYDYIMYIDMDVVIMEPAITIESFIVSDKDVIMTEDWSGANTGVWIAKNSPWTHWFLRTAFAQDQLVPPTSSSGAKYPFEYEQRAVHYMLNTEVWKSRNLPAHPQYKDTREHITLLPQCAFNSYSVHFLETRADREVSQYVKGDFVIHFAGKKGQIKVNLLLHYLHIAEENFYKYDLNIK